SDFVFDRDRGRIANRPDRCLDRRYRLEPHALRLAAARQRQGEVDDLLELPVEKIEQIETDSHGNVLRRSRREHELTIEDAADGFLVIEEQRPVELDEPRGGVAGRIRSSNEQLRLDRQLAARDGGGDARDVDGAEIAVA